MSRQSPRVLVLSASVGAGHMRAAQAVELAMKELRPDAEVRNIDVLELTNAAFRQFYGRAYLDLVNRAPHVLGYFYDYMGKPRRANSTRDRLRLALEKLNLGKFVGLIQSEAWDLAICTHFLPAEIIASLRNQGKTSLAQMTVTTDFETHRLWVNQPCEIYCTATGEGARFLESFGVPREATRVTGIPIHPAFAVAREARSCREMHGIPTDRPVILQLAGGFGVGPVEQLFQAILAIDLPLALVVVAGKNAKLKTELEAMPVPPRHHVKVLGFTDRMDELMAAADIVVSKPGGLTTSEILARGAAMVVVNPIPGQESRNSDFLLENGAAVKVNNVATLPYKLHDLLADPARLASIREKARHLGKPRAAYEVCQQALALIS